MSTTSARLKLLAALAALVMTVTACGSEAGDDGDGSGDSQPEGGGTELLVEALDFRFEVEGATLPEPGQDVTVRLENAGEAPHTFSSEEVDLDIEADPGGDGEGTFTVPESGTVNFQCDIHPDQMTLTLTSGEPASSDAGSGESESETENESEGESTADDDYDY